MAVSIERAYLNKGGSTSAKPNGGELIAEKYADNGSARKRDVSRLIGIPIMLPIFKLGFINENNEIYFIKDFLHKCYPKRIEWSKNRYFPTFKKLVTRS
jgi:hypothetical protein